ncbi:hypothetical protein [Deinococcus humi]|uniref:Uncharacterized protein n=1 Tax=Deinococcus humi TaxID=662880 RepID=A0A7W8JZA2_9DEIO|nr:hypothetical protein [Deinococcus humi]MBB5365725.1 hypothetical protein [Deinococcus humi]GGO38439.1 hypothetical protein GCM10008949_44980 [Deinococcus humi]
MRKEWLKGTWLGVLAAVSVAFAAPTVTDPKTAEVYQGGLVTVTINNDQAVPLTATIRLVGENLDLSLVSSKEVPKQSVRVVPVKLTVPEANYVNGATTLRAQLVTRLSYTPTGGEEVVLLSTMPTTVHAQAAVLSSSPSLYWVPPLAALLLVILVATTTPARAGGMQAAEVRSGDSWLTSFTFISTLLSAIVGQLALDPANKVQLLIVGALVVALLAFAPLVYGAFVRNGSAPRFAFLLASGITIAAATLALTVAFLLASRLSGIVRSLGVDASAANDGETALKVALGVIAVGMAVFAVQSMRSALTTTSAAEDAPARDGVRWRTAPALL